MQTVQLAIADSVYAAALREALLRSGPWQVEPVKVPDPNQRCVLVLDEEALERVRLPIPYPERVVLLTSQDPDTLSHAWEAGIVSVVSANDPSSTILLAIMAAALRVPKPQPVAVLSGFSPNRQPSSAPICPDARLEGANRCKTR